MYVFNTQLAAEVKMLLCECERDFSNFRLGKLGISVEILFVTFYNIHSKIIDIGIILNHFYETTDKRTDKHTHTDGQTDIDHHVCGQA